MSITRWKKPSNGQENDSPVLYSSPFGNLMENFFNDNFLTREFSSAVPAVNVSEDKDKFSVDLSAPGFNKEDFKIEADDKMLTISGEHKTEKEDKSKTFTRREFNYGSFRRSFSLPESVDDEKIDAKYENGILKITLHKREEAKPKPIKEISIS
ncbi:MAG TPA: Hsp20/alpha crystallin family protein [Bacteroidia bacterium]|jgi:HSP20 family protein